MDAVLQENELKMRKDIVSEGSAMLEAAGAKNIETGDGGHEIGDGIHEMGSARMGKDPKTSVLNSHNQVWDAKCVSYRWRLHDFIIMCKPITYIYGINRKGRRFCCGRIEERKFGRF